MQLPLPGLRGASVPDWGHENSDVGMRLYQSYCLPRKQAHDRGPVRLAHDVNDGDRDCRICPAQGHHSCPSDDESSDCGLDGRQTYRRTPALTFGRERKSMGGKVGEMEIEQRV